MRTVFFLGVAVLSVACSSGNSDGTTSANAGANAGGAMGTAGSGHAGSAGASNSGANAGTSGAAASTGGASTGGASTGGASTGGASTGGASTGGASTGGASTGGASTGGASTGGASAGGASAGGASAGGASAGGASAGGASGSTSNPLSQALIDEFVTAHNNARAGTLNPQPAPALPPVSWDPILADSAYNYLVKCVPNGALVAHNADRSTDYQALGGSGYVGENIYASTAKTVTAAQAVSSWMSEASAYDYSTNDLSAAGHYTQVVWRTSVRIGCAIVNCPGVMYPNTILCDYAPGGNISGQKPY